MKSALPLLLAFSAATLPLAAADWPQLLGPQRDGVADASEHALAKTPGSEPKQVWEKDLGSGHAGPVVAEGKVIIFHRVGDQAVVEALDAKTGDEIWSYKYPTSYVDSFGFDNGPRGCPAVADGKVVVHGAEGLVHALDLKTGKLLWTYDTVKETGSEQGYFGRACSPLIAGDEVILTPGGRTGSGGAAVIALNLKDGQLKWQAGSDEASYSSPVLHQAGDASLLFCWLRNQLMVCDAKTGAIKFSERLRSAMDASVNSAVPVFCGDHQVFVSACYGVGSYMWKWEPNGHMSQEWQKDDALDSHYGTPVYDGGYLYGFNGRQEQGQTLRCVKASNGQVMWESPTVRGGTLLRVKNVLVVFTEGGELWEVEATPEKFNQISSAQVLRSGHRSHAAFSNGIWYGRDAKHLVALALPE